MSLNSKTIIVTGSSRGIGREIALKCASDGANIVIIGKTSTPHPTLKGTIFSVAKEVENAGGQALPIELDLRDDHIYQDVIQKIMDRFGAIHALVNNASALFMAPIEETPSKKYDLIHGVNGRATFLFTQACLPHLLTHRTSDVITISPPLNLKTKEFGRCPAYTMSKYNMSMVTLSLSQTYRRKGVRANSLWPKTTVATSAIKNTLPKAIYMASRHARIMGDAAYEILIHNDQNHTGNFYLDDDVLINAGATSLMQYKRNRLLPTVPDLFL
jgi:citronellol/citronellal dehydrogenase